MYYIATGQLYLKELDTLVDAGEIIGEIGIFSPFKQRTATGICKTPLTVYEMSEEKMIQLYYQNPRFGFSIIKLIIKRFINTYMQKKE
jgi:CRP-like cAMP-binding protein